VAMRAYTGAVAACAGIINLLFSVAFRARINNPAVSTVFVSTRNLAVSAVAAIMFLITGFTSVTFVTNRAFNCSQTATFRTLPNNDTLTFAIQTFSSALPAVELKDNFTFAIAFGAFFPKLTFSAAFRTFYLPRTIAVFTPDPDMIFAVANRTFLFSGSVTNFASFFDNSLPRASSTSFEYSAVSFAIRALPAESADRTRQLLFYVIY